MIEVLMLPVFRPEDQAHIAGEGYHITYAAQPTPKQLAGAEVILGDPTLEQLSHATKLRWLQLTSSGTDRYTQQPGFPDGVMLTNATGAFGQSISEFVLTATLMLMKGMHRYRDNQRQAIWRDEGQQHTPVGKQILIFGAGNIGSHCARLFRPFGCHITGVRRVAREIPPEFDEMISLSEAEERLPEADVVICALPNTPETRGWFDRRRLGLLKPSAYLINVGRGNLIDCMALSQQLSAGQLAGAALDVTNPEPLPPEHPLWHAPNAIVTPHITGLSFGHLEATSAWILELCRDNLCRYGQGSPLRNQVDFATGYVSSQS